MSGSKVSCAAASPVSQQSCTRSVDRRRGRRLIRIGTRAIGDQRLHARLWRLGRAERCPAAAPRANADSPRSRQYMVHVVAGAGRGVQSEARERARNLRRCRRQREGARRQPDHPLGAVARPGEILCRAGRRGRCRRAVEDKRAHARCVRKPPSRRLRPKRRLQRQSQLHKSAEPRKLHSHVRGRQSRTEDGARTAWAPIKEKAQAPDAQARNAAQPIITAACDTEQACGRSRRIRLSQEICRAGGTRRTSPPRTRIVSSSRGHLRQAI